MGTAGIIEMLLQSQNDELHLLPALPDAWHDGAVRGMVARGNFVVDIEWKKGTLEAARIEGQELSNASRTQERLNTRPDGDINEP